MKWFHRHKWIFIKYDMETSSGIYNNTGECISHPSIYKCEKCEEKFRYCEFSGIRIPFPLFRWNKRKIKLTV